VKNRHQLTQYDILMPYNMEIVSWT